MIHVLVSQAKKGFVNSSMEKSTLGAELVKGSSLTFNSLVPIVEQSQNFMKQFNCAKTKFHIIAPLYLKLKDVFAEGIDLDESYCGMSFSDFIASLTKNYDPEVVSKALYLLGLSLGWEYTYKAIYRTTRIPLLLER